MWSRALCGLLVQRIHSGALAGLGVNLLCRSLSVFTLSLAHSR